MSDIFDALIGGEGTVDPASLAQGLRRKQAMGTLAALTGISGLQKLGPQMVEEAGKGAQDYATLRDRSQNQLLQRAIAKMGIETASADRAAAQAAESRRAQEHNDTMLAISKNRPASMASATALSPEEDAALQKAINDGRVSPDKINYRNQKIMAQTVLNYPDADLNKLAGEGAQARNVTSINRAQIIEQIPTILQNVVDAGKAMNFSNNKLVGSIQKLGAEWSNDPKFAKYMAVRNDNLLALAAAFRGTGMSDYATKLENEVQHPTQSPQALEGWLQGQMQAAKPRLEQAATILRHPATSAAAPSAEAPVPPPAAGTPPKVVNFAELP
jgi:hypothetical protein